MNDPASVSSAGGAVTASFLHIKEVRTCCALIPKPPSHRAYSQGPRSSLRRWIVKSLETSPPRETRRIWTTWKLLQRSWSYKPADHPIWSGRSGYRADRGRKVIQQTVPTLENKSFPCLRLREMRTQKWLCATSVALTLLMMLWSFWEKSWWVTPEHFIYIYLNPEIYYTEKESNCSADNVDNFTIKITNDSQSCPSSLIFLLHFPPLSELFSMT